MYLRRSLVAAMVLPLLALVGCQSESEPASMPNTVEPTPTEAVTSRTTQEPAGEYEDGSPEAFIVEWQAAGDEFQRTGDPAEFAKLNQDCRQCDDFIARVAEIHAGGGRIEFAGTRIVDIAPVEGGRNEFRVAIELPEQRVLGRSGEVTKKYEAATGAWDLVLVRVGGEWKVASQMVSAS